MTQSRNSGAGSVGGDERIRLFIAFRLPRDSLDGLVAWQQHAFAGGDRIRPVKRESLHVTLAFLGHRPRADLEAITASLRAAAAEARRPVFSVRAYRETRSVGMLVLDDEEGAATRLVEELHGRLAELGVYERERRPWLPHLTVLRFRERPALRPELPALAPFSPSDAAVYHSVLRPGGAQYEVLESAPLGG